ncbi:putative inorganic carbon transporter subunit DabA [Gracilibacillus sp. S3-1-1]|uniref:Inorganic carbon transporter subunit DabA n=1 Tax=Gracilibacillus pellucidus TaxID=3095368 RepID=A0ACC6M400_9BACI|nr:putative inorganic carbon transporter subunit DabA [Gracilibacillus sp. S3-1-1]MDX8045656.1 putative inorganic carbon transporter subunit DabA [Gracilibacillus sp. S3-1-1]
MEGTSVLTKETKQHIDNDAQDLLAIVEAASRVIAPLSPISSFAARNPWAGLEQQSFEQVADWLKDTRAVDIYPSPSMIHSAKEKGEIDEAFVELALQRWLEQHTFSIPSDVIKRYSDRALQLKPLPTNVVSKEELAKWMTTYTGANLYGLGNVFAQPIATHITNKKGEKLVKLLDNQVIKWCKLYLDENQAGWTMPNREKGFYLAWKHLISRDPALSKKQRGMLKELPDEPQQALEQALTRLGIEQAEIQTYLEGHLLSLPGWAGMMLWQSEQSNNEKMLLTEYLAIRIVLEATFVSPYLPLREVPSKQQDMMANLLASLIHWGGLTLEQWSQMEDVEQDAYLVFAYCFDDNVRRKLWLEAWEQTHAERLSQQMLANQDKFDDKEATLAQLAFCIDVRSEPFRRHLEKEGPFETIGIAGFFGLPIATRELGSNYTHPSLPVTSKPQHTIMELAGDDELGKFRQRKQTVNAFTNTFKKMKQNVLSSLLLPELSGPWLSAHMLTRSFTPRSANRWMSNLLNKWEKKPSTKLSLDHEHHASTNVSVGFSKEEKVSYVRQSLKLMGLTDKFAPLVVICGHGSHSTNNPYSAALECGACGGAAGGFNARVLATLCNLPEVREALALEGIDIPEETIFVAAEHKTTVDELEWVYVPELSEAAQVAYDRIESVMPAVSHNTNQERLSRLPNFQSECKNPKEEAYRFASDWSEIRPEWGLARNAAFIIGRRELTEACDLEGRAFLHHYDYHKDEDGALLANIIEGPATVSQMINLQYYASTVAPHYYGSGSKATQTVTAGLGVMQGNASDLLPGLPWQSVMQSDDEAYHSPIRLLIVIQAPNEHIERLLNNDRSFRAKVDNGWVRLASIDEQGIWKNW